MVTTRRRLRGAQVLVVIILMALADAGRRTDFWPIHTWPVYSFVRFPDPVTRYRLREVRAFTSSGELRRLHAADLLEWSRASIAETAIERAGSGNEQARVYLARLVQRILGEHPERLEVWLVEWNVARARLPPVDLWHPDSETRLAAFATTHSSAP